MKSFEFLKENTDAFAQFFADTTEYFSHIKNPHNTMYRGDRKYLSVDNFLKNTRNVIEGRQPVDTDEIVHSIVNDLLASTVKFPFRSGVMCTGSMSTASEYGRANIIVPCNGYIACYSPVYADMYSNLVGSDEVQHALHVSQGDADPALEKVVRKKFIEGKYVAGTGIVEAAILSNHEIMLYPDDYSTLEFYAFTESFYTKNIVPRILERRGQPLAT